VKERSVFEDRPELYDALVDWSKRLAREEPFFRAVFEQVAARRVLDAACGTGRHAALFQSGDDRALPAAAR
jgi:SAM-dependent methyltransferase